MACIPVVAHSVITVRPMAGVSVEQREAPYCTHRHDNIRRRANARPPQDIRYSAEAGCSGLAVLAVQAIRKMRGGAQSQLMLGADGKLWVVKFQNNPQDRAGAGE